MLPGYIPARLDPAGGMTVKLEDFLTYFSGGTLPKDGSETWGEHNAEMFRDAIGFSDILTMEYMFERTKIIIDYPEMAPEGAIHWWYLKNKKAYRAGVDVEGGGKLIFIDFGIQEIMYAPSLGVTRFDIVDKVLAEVNYNTNAYLGWSFQLIACTFLPIGS